jgi:isoquinoline 1-oxidoreductase subunit beta
MKYRPEQLPDTDDALSRRSFLHALGLGSGLLLGAGWLVAGTPQSAPPLQPLAPGAARFNAFISISPDSRVTVVIKHLEMGQGVTTGLTSLVAEELGARWEQMAIEFAPADASRYNNLDWGDSQGTGGSSAMSNSWLQLRRLGAAAREMLRQAAAQHWQVPLAEVRIEQGLVRQGERQASFGELAQAAARLPAPQQPPLKDPKDFQLLGKTLPRQDNLAKTNGTAVYTQDIHWPGLLVAVVAYPPKLGGRLKDWDASAAKALPGVVAVVPFPRGLAVVADSVWRAQQARKALKINWDLSACETRSSEELFAHCHSLAAGQGHPITHTGNAAAILAQAGAERTLSARYELPFLAHAPIEPMNCVAKVEKTQCELWYAAQLHSIDQQQVAQALKLKPFQVKINSLIAGGSFGRRACPDDYVIDTVSIAKQLPGRAIKLVWTREDEWLNARFRPMAVHHVRAALDAQGKLAAWQHHTVSPSVMRGTPFAKYIQGPVDGSIAEGIKDLQYSCANLQVSGTELQTPISSLWWRSVGHSGNAFVTETLIDQLARLAQQDPLAFRRAHLSHEPRALAVLDGLQAHSGWGQAPQGRFLGMALHKSFHTWVGQVVQLRLEGQGYVVEKVTCVLDCGFAVNPDVVRAQMESAIGMGLSVAQGEAITLKNGAVEQTNFHKYPVLRMPQMPQVVVHTVPSQQPPSGVGEPGVPPVAGALANALFAARGTPITRLPLGPRPG